MRKPGAYSIARIAALPKMLSPSIVSPENRGALLCQSRTTRLGFADVVSQVYNFTASGSGQSGAKSHPTARLTAKSSDLASHGDETRGLGDYLRRQVIKFHGWQVGDITKIISQPYDFGDRENLKLEVQRTIVESVTCDQGIRGAQNEFCCRAVRAYTCRSEGHPEHVRLLDIWKQLAFRRGRFEDQRPLK